MCLFSVVYLPQFFNTKYWYLIECYIIHEKAETIKNKNNPLARDSQQNQTKL